MEARCEEFQKKIDEINEQHESILRQQTASQSTNTAQTQTFVWKAPAMQGGSIQQVINIHRIRFARSQISSIIIGYFVFDTKL